MNKPLEISYQKKNGLKYPELQISNDSAADSTPLGKYGQMCLKYLFDEHPERYAELRMNGNLMPLMHKVNDEAFNQVDDLADKMLKQAGYSESSDDLVKIRRKNAMREIAEEVVIREYVYQPR